METPFDWRAWRKAKRERLIAGRLALTQAARETIGARVIERLDGLVDLAEGSVVSFYWPFKGEFDLRGWVGSLRTRGIRSALPVVVEKKQPMRFRLWSPGCRMERGVWNIPVPADGPDVTPDVTIAPLVGFDPDCYRLGYGGGYFDRTLATLSPKPFAVGVGFELGRLETVFPQPHDIGMDAIVTEAQAFSSNTVPAR
jgi:5-formyltetrahydrofolate cyclo-ligase